MFEGQEIVVGEARAAVYVDDREEGGGGLAEIDWLVHPVVDGLASNLSSNQLTTGTTLFLKLNLNDLL